jgi:hypothetical protein
MTRLPPVAPAQRWCTIAACRSAAPADVTAVTEFTVVRGFLDSLKLLPWPSLEAMLLPGSNASGGHA